MKNNKENLLFIVNPFSGISSKADFSKLVHKYIDKEKYIFDIVYTEYPKHATELSRKALKENVDIIVVVGGDGSINEVAKSIVKTDVKLGIIPEGSGNGLSKHLNIPKNVPRAIQIINDAKTIKIDSCTVNNSFFLNVMGVGYDAYVAYLTKFNKRRGLVPYVSESLKNSINWKAVNATIFIEGEKINTNALTVVIANGSMYGYNFTISPESSITDGKLEVLLFETAPLYKYFFNAYRLLNKSIHKLPFVKTFRTNKLKIVLDEQNYIHKDGEGYQSDTELNIELIPQSIKVIVP